MGEKDTRGSTNMLHYTLRLDNSSSGALELYTQVKGVWCKTRFCKARDKTLSCDTTSVYLLWLFLSCPLTSILSLFLLRFYSCRFTVHPPFFFQTNCSPVSGLLCHILWRTTSSFSLSLFLSFPFLFLLSLKLVSSFYFCSFLSLSLSLLYSSFPLSRFSTAFSSR